MHGVLKHQTFLLDARPLSSVWSGLEVSRCDVLKHGIVQCLIGHQTLESGIFLLQLFKPFVLIHFETALLLAPAIITLWRDSNLLAGLLDARSLGELHLYQAQICDDLFGAYPFSSWHSASLVVSDPNLILGSS